MAVKPREIQTGNYFNVPNPAQCPFRIDCIELLHPSDGFGKFGMYMKGFENAHPLTWYLKDLEPIQITEEWLLKFGFKKGGSEYKLFPSFGTQFIADFTGEELWFMAYTRTVHSDYKEVYLATPIKYVHQLQNLCFILTGEELN